jgi:hypothetical protein
MRLYHGTNVDFDVIDITKSQKFKDFGQGFYLTDIYTQAEELAKKKARLFGGSPVVQVYEFDDVCLNTSRLKVCLFKEADSEWAEFIFKNRNKKYADFKHGYDIVIGPIADDGVAYLLGRYAEGSFSIEDLAKELKYKKLNRQYFFGTAQAIGLLKRIKQ